MNNREYSIKQALEAIENGTSDSKAAKTTTFLAVRCTIDAPEEPIHSTATRINNVFHQSKKMSYVAG